ncbi:hypothetical protein B0H14DRAFT_2613011 [Mycena olivaceomarginata]|nr:hypothetical protein B0H14DRAFT_2613011 [Mycena olivaceomarginata]
MSASQKTKHAPTSDEDAPSRKIGTNSGARKQKGREIKVLLRQEARRRKNRSTLRKGQIKKVNQRTRLTPSAHHSQPHRKQTLPRPEHKSQPRIARPPLHPAHPQCERGHHFSSCPRVMSTSSCSHIGRGGIERGVVRDGVRGGATDGAEKRKIRHRGEWVIAHKNGKTKNPPHLQRRRKHAQTQEIANGLGHSACVSRIRTGVGMARRQPQMRVVVMPMRIRTLPRWGAEDEDVEVGLEAVCDEDNGAQRVVERARLGAVTLHGKWRKGRQLRRGDERHWRGVGCVSRKGSWRGGWRRRSFSG